MEAMKTNLFMLRNSLSKSRKSNPWTEEKLLRVLKGLKGRKCTDQIGMIYDLFKPGVIGTDLFHSLLMFCNETKDRVEVIDALKKADINSIYKEKGSRLDLRNERGIFSEIKVSYNYEMKKIMSP